jgi:acetoacetate decarboxylase
MTIPLDQIVSIPAFSPYYPMLPARYRNVKFHHVFFRAELSAISRVLPACFELSEDGMCSAVGLTVPWSGNYGAFDESALSVKCMYKGQEGWFTVVAFLNSKSSIPAGREIYGTPKVYADFRIDFAERVMYTDTLVAGTALMSIRTTLHREAEVEDMPKQSPTWRLKVIPRVDGKGVDVMQLIGCANVSFDVTVHVCRAGDGIVHFNPSPIYDLSDFAPLEYYGAYYVEMDYTEGYGEIIHDFLKDG